MLRNLADTARGQSEHNYTASTDPEAWKVVDGKLYLNNSKSVQKMWEQDQAKWITEADKNWPGLHK